MAEETKTTEKLPADGGEPVDESRETHTEPEEARDAESREPDYKRMYLDAKNKIESANQLAADYAALKERLDQSPADPSDERGRDGEHWEQIRAYEAKGDPLAQGLREIREGLEARDKLLTDALMLRDIDDKQERAAVLDLYRKNPGRYGDPMAARSAYREKKLEEENAKLKEEIERRPKPPKSSPPPTSEREGPTPKSETRKISAVQFDKDVEELRAQGRHKAAMALQNQYAKGEIELVD